MTMLRAALRELAGLFVEDGSFALQIVAVVVLAGIAAILFPEAPLAAGAILLVGCLGVLLANAWSSRRSANRPEAILKH